jgi:quercetin dioxygenase-like cupin family protein
MKDDQRYSIHLNEKYGPLEVIDIPHFAAQVQEAWLNQTLCRVNDCVIRVGVFKKGEFHWHKHDREDEFFFVVSGTLKIELEGKVLMLQPHQGFMVPRGIVHKTSVAERTVVVMVEAVTVQPTGD